MRCYRVAWLLLNNWYSPKATGCFFGFLFPWVWVPSGFAQTFQKPLIKEYTLNHICCPNIIRVYSLVGFGKVWVLGVCSGLFRLCGFRSCGFHTPHLAADLPQRVPILTTGDSIRGPRTPLVKRPL